MASNKNEVTIEGNMIRDPELKTTYSGVSICNFTIASNRYFKKRDEDEFEKETSFFDIQCWGKTAEDVSVIGRKGAAASVLGRLKQERWTDREGIIKTKIIIVAESVQFIERQGYERSEKNTDACPF
jgi:single-strand DNA-binding protein